MCCSYRMVPNINSKRNKRYTIHKFLIFRASSNTFVGAVKKTGEYFNLKISLPNLKNSCEISSSLKKTFCAKSAIKAEPEVFKVFVLYFLKKIYYLACVESSKERKEQDAGNIIYLKHFKMEKRL